MAEGANLIGKGIDIGPVLAGLQAAIEDGRCHGRNMSLSPSSGLGCMERNDSQQVVCDRGRGGGFVMLVRERWEVGYVARFTK